MLTKLTGPVLVLSPHTDDAELGCGATIARLLEEGAEVHIAVFSTAAESLPEGLAPDTLERECRAAMIKMGVPTANLSIFKYPVRRLSYHRQEVLDALVNLRKAVAPSVVFAPASTDLHQDHQVLHAEGMRAFKTRTFLGYELPWNHVEFSAHAFVDVQPRHLDLKWEALQEYGSQLALKRAYFQKDFVWSVARMRGVQVGVEFAEAFQVCRLRW